MRLAISQQVITYDVHIGQKVVSHDLHIRSAYIQQFIENQKLLGGETLPIDPMKYVDSSLVDTALRA